METWKLIVVGIFIHTVFFYSIFDIYFTSPIVHGMTPHKSPAPAPAPAKRLVLFSADGLRADKMFELEEGKPRIPYLRNIIETSGAWGVSHTRVPTESRPGHVALIAGFYEDVSAVAKGWKENPVEFDSVFNESRYTWSWGSPDILPMFAKGASGDHVFTDCYPAELENFASANLSSLDTWVFDKVKDFFASGASDAGLRDKLHQDQIVFFLHLLGLDTNGHSQKPYSREYLDNIRLVDDGIREMVDLVESFYGHDGKTAYVMTSDHGMTDWGSHGAGHPSETLTPLVAWGAGVRSMISEASGDKYPDSFSKDWQLDHLRRTDVEQADVAPLMAALLGTNFPVNSVGLLPYDYLGLSDFETAEAMFANTRQILEQYQVKMELKKSTTLSFAFRPFKDLTASDVADKYRHLRKLIQTGKYQDAISECQAVMQVALRGLNYYQTYDRLFLGVSVASGFCGWMAYILTVVFEKHSGVVRTRVKLERTQNGRLQQTDRKIVAGFLTVGSVISVLLFVQSLPWTNYLYCLIPVILWMVVALRRDIIQQVYRHALIMKHKAYSLTAVLACLVGLEIVVLGFFYREMFSLGLALMSILPFLLPMPQKVEKGPLLMWALSCIILAVFPLLPVVTGKRKTAYVIAGGCIVIAVAISRWLSLPERIKHSWMNLVLLSSQILCICLSIYFSGFAVQSGLTGWQHAFSWVMLGVSLVEPLLSSTNLSHRLLTVFLAFTAPFVLLSVFYETLFLVSLCLLLQQWMYLEAHLYGRKSSAATSGPAQMLDSLDFGHTSSAIAEKSRSHLVIQDTQQALYFVFLILTAFFGTGNIASINSFDPASVLCFVSVFSPFVMGALMLFKVVVPFVLVTCTLQAIHTISRVPIHGLFLLIMLMSDCMALHFFFLVQDHGSWLDIGTSISHYVIVMCMIIFSMLLFGLSHLLTRVRLAIPH